MKSILWLLLVIISIAFSQAVTTHTKLTVELDCYSDTAVVTRYFYVESSDAASSFTLDAYQYGYSFFVDPSLKPELLTLIDSNGADYQPEILDDECVWGIFTPFPKTKTHLGPRDQYYIVTKYRSGGIVVSQTDGTKRLDMAMRTFNQTTFEMPGDMQIDEVRVLLPECLFLKRHYLHSMPPETDITEIDGGLVITYNSGALSTNISEVYEEEYPLGPVYAYELDLWALAGAIVLFVTLVPSIYFIMERAHNTKK